MLGIGERQPLAFVSCSAVLVVLNDTRLLVCSRSTYIPTYSVQYKQAYGSPRSVVGVSMQGLRLFFRGGQQHARVALVFLGTTGTDSSRVELR